MPSAPTYLDCIICTQVHWFIYSSTTPSLEVFRDDYFKSMLLAMVPPQEKIPKHPVLTIPKLKLLIDAEWECFCWLITSMLSQKYKESKGNAFAQFIHDGCTLKSKSKYQAFGLQFTDSRYQCNHVVALSFKRAFSSTGINVAIMARNVVKEITNHNFSDICGCSVQDSAAKSIARHLDLEEETCDMHDTDKIGRSAIGELLRKKGERFVNPFPPGMYFQCCYTYIIYIYLTTSIF